MENQEQGNPIKKGPSEKKEPPRGKVTSTDYRDLFQGEKEHREKTTPPSSPAPEPPKEKTPSRRSAGSGVKAAVKAAQEGLDLLQEEPPEDPRREESPPPEEPRLRARGKHRAPALIVGVVVLLLALVGVGYLATTPEIKAVMYKLFQHTLSCVSGFIQKAAVVALDCTQEIEDMRQQYERRRDLFVNGLNRIEGVSCSCPEGAFYAWVTFDIPGLDSEAVCDLILNQAKVVGVPGVAYGTDDCCVRFSFAASDDDLTRAVSQIARTMEQIRNKQ